jgi:hypothetical protein
MPYLSFNQFVVHTYNINTEGRQNRGLSHCEPFLPTIIWQNRLWSFQGQDTKSERFLAKNQLKSNDIFEI